MSVTLTVHENKPAVELVNHKGECFAYHFEVQSNTEKVFRVKLTKRDGGDEPSYVVSIGDRWHVCDCKDYQMRKRKAGLLCKHLTAAHSLRPLLGLLPAVAAPAQEKRA